MKRIICDFDDTLAFTTKRDWDNAIPNIKLIEKLNALYDIGWVIDIYTARGSLSCSSRKEADKTYRHQIEKWLKNYNVKYSSLCFDKPLATYYIDDKGIKPDEFIDLQLIPLYGLSGSEIFALGNEVYKTEKNVVDVIEWYNEVSNLTTFNTPQIYSVVGDTIKMEYINNVKLYDLFLANRLTIYEYTGKICSILDQFSVTTKKIKYNYETYINRINEHINLITDSRFLELGLSNVVSELESILPILTNSFSHGDFSIDNILIEKQSNDIFLIDPINSNFFSSFEIDSAKFLASTHLYFNEFDFSYLENSLCFLTKLSRKQFYNLMICELIRTIKYSNDNRKNKILKLIKLWISYV